MEAIRAKNVKLDRISVYPDKDGLVELSRLADAGELKVHVAKAFPLDQAGAALEFLATRPIGKVVLTM